RRVMEDILPLFIPIIAVGGFFAWMIALSPVGKAFAERLRHGPVPPGGGTADDHAERSEEHTSELQSRGHLVCRPLLEKKKKSSVAASRASASPLPRIDPAWRRPAAA